MDAKGTTPLSAYGLTDREFIEKLVKPPKNRQGETGGASFRDALDSAAGLSGPRATGTTSKKAEDRRLRDACVEMESLLVGKMLKEMRKTVHKSGWINGGFAEEIFEDMLYDEYALSLSKNSNLGLADMLYTQLSRKG